MIRLKQYQSIAVEQLLDNSERLLNSSENEICIFQAPTGSGKTLIIAEFLKRLISLSLNETKFSFVWLTVRQLHDQSKDKLERYYEKDRILTCSYFEDLEDRKIGENEILFINWESINKKDINIYVRENEQENNLNSIIKNTKDENRQVLLIIDESHHTASSAKSKELIEVISPKITIEASATPQLKDSISALVKVHLSEVKDEEMIKSEILVNPEFLNLKVGTKSADELVIDQALKKRKQLCKLYEAEGSNINPLVLIQLPDTREGLKDKKEEIVNSLKSFDISEANGKLAVWLSEDKSDTLPNIQKNDNDVEVLVFKQAIALGWDCPRASILVIFRESKSFTFTIQTIGRIMRMPELKYYTKEPELNKGYVFTNLSDIRITEDYAKDYVSVYESKRRSDIYRNIDLSSVSIKKQRERARLSGGFIEFFLDVTKRKNLSEKITPKPSRLVSPIIADATIPNIDKVGEVERLGTIDVGLNEKELQYNFDKFVGFCCVPFAPRDSSDSIKRALYHFMEKEFNINKYDSVAQRIILGKENIQHFIDSINLSKEQYVASIRKQAIERSKVDLNQHWEVPIIISYNSRYTSIFFRKTIMKPFFVRNMSEPERGFMRLIAESNRIKWWFKNGENDDRYFAILYKDENGVRRAFYVDFIIAFTNGVIGLFDTKSGITAKDAAKRAEGLQKYVHSEKSKGKDLWGGIVIYVNGTWRYNDGKKYHYDENDLTEWKVLEI